jgi:hypothetical protein
MIIATTDGNDLLQIRRYNALAFVIITPAHNFLFVRDQGGVIITTGE